MQLAALHEPLCSREQFHSALAPIGIREPRPSVPEADFARALNERHMPQRFPNLLNTFSNPLMQQQHQSPPLARAGSTFSPTTGTLDHQFGGGGALGSPARSVVAEGSFQGNQFNGMPQQQQPRRRGDTSFDRIDANHDGVIDRAEWNQHAHQRWMDAADARHQQPVQPVQQQIEIEKQLMQQQLEVTALFVCILL